MKFSSYYKPSKKLDEDLPKRRGELTSPQISISNKTASFRKGLTINQSRVSKISSSDRVEYHELKNKSRWLLKNIGLLLGSIVILVIVIGQFIFKIDVSLENVNTPIPEEKLAIYEETIDDYLGDNPVERFVSSVKSDNLQAYIAPKHAEIARVNSVNAYFLSPTRFSLEARKPLAMWIIGGQKRYVDKDGVAFSKNFFEDPPIKVIDKSGVEGGSAPLASSQFLGFIGRFVYLAQVKGYEVKEITIPPGTIRQVDVILEGTGYPVKVLTSRSAAGQVEDMDNTVSYLKDKNLVPKYIDVRVENKAFYLM